MLAVVCGEYAAGYDLTKPLANLDTWNLWCRGRLGLWCRNIVVLDRGQVRGEYIIVVVQVAVFAAVDMCVYV